MYHAHLTPMLIDATIYNDLQTSLDFITIPAILCILFWITTSAFFIFFRAKITFHKKLTLSIIALFSIIVLVNISQGTKYFLPERFPYNVYYKTKEYCQLIKTKNNNLYNPDKRAELVQRKDSLITVFIIGESLRADHLSINGYNRNTTEHLKKESNIISFPSIYSHYTYTNRSLPHIVTRADSVFPERAFTEKSFISSFNIDGFHTYWIANQDIAKSYYSFANECNEIQYVHPGNSVFFSQQWYDAEMLPLFKDILNESNPRKLIIMHCIGNHWYYNNHFDTQKCTFDPITTNKDTRFNSPEQIINSYDNVIVETDKFLFQIISELKQKNAIVIYLSDHGEALGENGQWLHGNECEAIKNPACFVWFSELYKKNYPQKIDALYENRNKRYLTDFLYHSILSCSNIQTNVIEKSLDIFSNK